MIDIWLIDWLINWLSHLSWRYWYGIPMITRMDGCILCRHTAPTEICSCWTKSAVASDGQVSYQIHVQNLSSLTMKIAISRPESQIPVQIFNLKSQIFRSQSQTFCTITHFTVLLAQYLIELCEQPCIGVPVMVMGGGKTKFARILGSRPWGRGRAP